MLGEHCEIDADAVPCGAERIGPARPDPQRSRMHNSSFYPKKRIGGCIPQEASMEQTHAVSVLNDVLQTLRDGEEGFSTAAGAVKDTHVKDVFEQYARQRAEMARELEQEI